MGEEFYDEEIAPALMRLAKSCEEHGLSLIAMVEFGPNETGSTFSVRENAGIEIQVARMAMRSQGNADMLIMGLRDYGSKHGHNSFMLKRLR